MPVLSTPQELLTALEGSAFAADPLRDLAQRGFTIAPKLHEQLLRELAGRTLASPPAGFSSDRVKGSFTFQQAAPILPADPAPGTYDVVAGLRFSVSNLVIDALFQSGTIPRRLEFDQIRQSNLETLEQFFRVPQRGGHISRLHVTAAPTLARIAGSSSADRSIVALRIPFQLDWTDERVIAGRTINQLVTFAAGTLQLTMKVVAAVAPTDPPGSSMLTVAVEFAGVSSAADSPRLTLEPSSPVQLKEPIPPDQVDGLAVQIQTNLAAQFPLELNFAVSQPIQLPTGNLSVTRADVVADGDVLVAGVQIVKEGSNEPPDPSTLGSLLSNADQNIFLQAQSTVPDRVVKSALAEGQLTALARQQQSNAVIDSASASFSGNAFVAQMHGRLVDECQFVFDLAFTLTRTTTITLNGPDLTFDQNDQQSPDLGSSLGCLLSSIGLSGLLNLGIALWGGIALNTWPKVFRFLQTQIGPLAVDSLLNDAENFLFGNSASPDPPTDLSYPIPGTDSVATLTGNSSIGVTDGALLITATASVQPDAVNTFIYVRFLVPDGNDIAAPKPLAGVLVRLMDQDVPAPAGDDAVIIVPPDRTIGKETAKYSFDKPLADQELQRAQTNFDGIVRFALANNELVTTAGAIKEVLVSDTLPPHNDETTFTPVVEAKPDLYFQVTMLDGSHVDTRPLPGGFIRNFTSSRVGSLSNPLTFVLGPGTSVVA